MKSKEKLYKVYYGMKYRCTNPNCKDYKWYGGKGIKICDEWKDYETFKNWALNNGYKEGLSIDRKDPTKNYEPLNCEWVTLSENSKRMNKHHNGSPCLGRKLTKEHKQKCGESIRKRYKTDPEYKLKVKHSRETNGNTKITVEELELLKFMKHKGYTRNEMYKVINCKVNRQYFNVIIRNLK